MSWTRCVLLLTALTVSSGYKFRCWWMCQDQTAIQNDYVEQRDRCRNYAQLKLDMAIKSSSKSSTDQARKATLVELFAQCMATNGWNMSDNMAAKETAEMALTPGQAAGVTPARSAADVAAERQAAISRAAECAFARQAASVSSISALRAKACDLECAQRLRLAPEAPRPAACPSGETPALASGFERVN